MEPARAAAICNRETATIRANSFMSAVSFKSRERAIGILNGENKETFPQRFSTIWCWGNLWFRCAERSSALRSIHATNACHGRFVARKVGLRGLARQNIPVLAAPGRGLRFTGVAAGLSPCPAAQTRYPRRHA